MCFRLFSKLAVLRTDQSSTTVNEVPSKFKMDFTEESLPGDPSDQILGSHPLLLRIVIIKTLNHLGVDDLKKCRQVCKKWNKVASHLLIDKTEFDCRKMYRKDIDGALEALAKDLCLLPQNFVYSFTSQHHQTCRKFMKYYGHRINSLRLRPWESIDVFSREDLASLLLQCPYLQSMSLSAIPDDLASSSHLFPGKTAFPNMTSLTLYGGVTYSVDFLCDLLTSMPNLGTLVVKGAYGKFLDQIFWLLKNPKYCLQDLKVLEILNPLEFNNDHLIRLELCAFQLKILNLTQIQMTSNAVGKIYLEPLLQTLAFTLEELTLPAFKAWAIESDVAGPIHTPKMLKLWKLQLEDWRLFGPLVFVRHSFPRLSVLILDDPNDRNNNEIQMAEHLKPHLRLTELTLPSYFHDHEALQEILIGFPKLKKLKLFVTDISMTVICKFGQQLEEIHMYLMSLVTDTGITGISKKQCEILRKENFKSSELNRVRNSNYSIQNLPSLKRLTLACAVQNFITDVSVLKGVVELKNLTNLCLRNCLITDFSLVALSKLPIQQLDLGSLDNSAITSIGLCYFQNQKPYAVLLYTKSSLTIENNDESN